MTPGEMLIQGTLLVVLAQMPSKASPWVLRALGAVGVAGQVPGLGKMAGWL